METQSIPANRAGVFGPKGSNRTSQIVTTIIAPNQVYPVYQAGTNFYLVVATDEIEIKPNNGSANNYVQGTGLVVDDLNIFNQLQIRNNNPHSVVIQMFVGFGNYIDNRLIVYDPTVIQAVYSTYGVTNTAVDVVILDKTGQAITGADGVPYLALNRVGIYVSNLDTGITYSIQNLDLSLTLLYVFPQTSITLPWSGDFAIRSPSANINAVVTEVYNAILA